MYVEKHIERPGPWREFRSAVKHRWLDPFLFSEWIFRYIAYYLSKWSLLTVLEYAGSFSVLVAVILYFAEAGERRQQKHYQAWQVINTAQGQSGSGGRIDALEQLNEDGVALTGVDARDAFLQGVKLEKAELRRAVFSGADMRDAHLAHANFSDAGLRSTNLRQADLRGVDFTGANLNGADLSGADLGGAKLAAENLNGVDLTGAELSGITGWESAGGIGGLIVTGVRNPPAGFLDFVAKQRSDTLAAHLAPSSQPATTRSAP